jgi:uncharacterized protein (DUF983 family)
MGEAQLKRLDAAQCNAQISGVDEKYPLPKLRTLLWRGCRKRCPQCGEGAMYRRWLTLHERCAVCGLEFVENQGDLWGMLLFVDRIIFIIPVIVLIYFRVWHPDLTVFLLFGGVLAFLAVYTLPHRNGITVALDYLFRRKDFTASSEPSESP